MPHLRNGHATGHVRETASNAFLAWLDWDGTFPEPIVEYEINYVPRHIPISQACGLVWNCTDIVPGLLFDPLQEEASQLTDGPAIKTRTYAACARFILDDIKKHATA